MICEWFPYDCIVIHKCNVGIWFDNNDISQHIKIGVHSAGCMRCKDWCTEYYTVWQRQKNVDWVIYPAYVRQLPGWGLRKEN